MINRATMLLDAKVLGVITRNLAAMPRIDADTQKEIAEIKNLILARYHAHDVLGCMLKIKMMARG